MSQERLSNPVTSFTDEGNSSKNTKTIKRVSMKTNTVIILKLIIVFWKMWMFSTSKPLIFCSTVKLIQCIQNSSCCYYYCGETHMLMWNSILSGGIFSDSYRSAWCPTDSPAHRQDTLDFTASNLHLPCVTARLGGWRASSTAGPGPELSLWHQRALTCFPKSLWRGRGKTSSHRGPGAHPACGFLCCATLSAVGEL